VQTLHSFLIMQKKANWCKWD